MTKWRNEKVIGSGLLNLSCVRLRRPRRQYEGTGTTLYRKVSQTLHERSGRRIGQLSVYDEQIKCLDLKRVDGLFG